MASQSPLISIPKKTTQDVDWTGPIRALIANSYGEDPNSYAEECSILQRTRQDAVRGAGSDQTARDLLYKYFGQLELLELRFAEIKVSFTWIDAFILKPTTQTSLAFEKASIIHLLSSVLSALAQSGSRADPEGVKRAYFNSRAAAGMLTYINENFLHAPSTDLSREVVHLLIGVMTAQSTEIFTEKLIEEKKAPALVCRSANTAASMYTALVEDMKEFQGKGIFDRNWLYILQIKAKLYSSLAQYYRATADGAAGKHGHLLVRIKLADTLAQDAQRQANAFTYNFVATATPSLPSDAATCLQEICKAHATLCSEGKVQAGKDNDLIYHDILPSEASLPAIEKLPAAAPITIQEVYTSPDVSKLIGPDIFSRLIPLAVHESASVYSEEKAKLVREEVERVELSEGELRAGLEHLGLPGAVSGWRRLIDDDAADQGDGDVEVSAEVRRLANDIRDGGNLGAKLRTMEGDRQSCEQSLRELNESLDSESRECERTRVQYAPSFTQSPSGQQTTHFRSSISSNLGSLSSAAASDSRVASLWQEIQPSISALSGGGDALRAQASTVAAGKQVPQANRENLLDLEEEYGVPKSGLEDGEKEELRKAVQDVQERLERLGKIKRERDDVLKDLKEKVQNDDVSNLLLLNRRSQNVEPQLFASELEKFRPYQSRLASAVQAAKSIMQELEMSVRQVERGKGVREKQRGQKDRQRRVRDWERGLIDAGGKYQEVRAGLTRGLSYYESLNGVINDLKRQVGDFVRSRESERNRMVGEIEVRKRVGGSPAGSAVSTSTADQDIHQRLANLALGSRPDARSPYGATSPPPPLKPVSSYASNGMPGLPPPPPHPSTPSFPPPPPASKSSSSMYDFSNPSFRPAFSTPTSPPPPPVVPQRQTSYGSAYSAYPPPSTTYPGSYHPPPPPPSQPSQYASPSQHQSYHPKPSSSQAYPGPPSQHSYTPPAPTPTSPAYPAPPAPQAQSSYRQPPHSQQPAYLPQSPSGSYASHQSPAHPAYPSISPPPHNQYQPYVPPPAGQSYPSHLPPPPQQPSQYYPPPSQGHQTHQYQYR